MPSVKLELGRYVTVRPRVDGTSRVLLEVPPRLRPSDWSATIPLPVEEPRTGDLTNGREVARIQADAARLYRQLQAARAGRKASADFSFRTLVEAWETSQRWKALKPRTQQGYREMSRYVLTWAQACGEPDPRKLTRAAVERYVASYDNRPALRYHQRKVLRLIMDQAQALGWRGDNPCDGVRVAMPRTQVEIWEQADVDRLMWAAAVGGHPDLAVLILTMWEIGQRLTDAIAFRRGAEYSAAEGMFRFRQSKTAAYVTVPVSDHLRGFLAAIERQELAVDGRRKPDAPSPFLFHDGGTGRPFRDVNRLGHVFEDLRRRAGGRHVVLRALRHSCVVQLARSGCTTLEVASITGHSVATVESILSVYLPRDSVVAENAQRRRGLIA